MTRLAILVPDGTINYITNPAMRYDATGWNSQGSTITRSLEQARFGIASLKVVTNGAALQEGSFFRVSVLSGINEPVTVSAYVRGTGRVRIRLDNNVLGGAEYSSQRIILDPDGWQRLTVSGFSTGGNDMRLFVETDEDSAIARTFYVDGAQMELKAYATTYCDGDQPGCRWSGTEHATMSERYSYSRAGGRWVQLAGEGRQEEDLYFTVAGGLGVAPTSLDQREFSMSPGGYILNRKILARPITFTFHAKHRVTVTNEGEPVSLSHLHELRELLIDILNPDAGRKEDAWFMYDDGLPLYFRARYEGGMEGDWDIRNQFVNSFPLRVLALEPFMVEDDRQVQELDFQDSVPGAVFNEVVGRIDGAWNKMNFGVNASVADIELSKKGELFIGGTFSFVNYNGSAIDPILPAQYIAYWDGIQWRTIAPSTTGTVINDIAVAPNGDIYVTGVFTNIAGVSATNIARWNGSIWSALGTGLNADGIHIAIDANGIVYAGGKFTTAGGVNAAYIAKWDGSQWHAMGQYSGFDNWVNSIAVTPDGATLYIGGNFTDQNGLAASALLRIAQYDVATDRFSAIGQGFDNNVLEVVLAKDEYLYACGDFTTSGGITVNHIAKFQGGRWTPLGDGMDDVVHSFDVGVNGDIVAVGEFENAGNVDARAVAIWNGSTWAHMDIDLNIGYTVLVPLAMQYLLNGDIIIAGSGITQNSSIFSAINYVNNIGTADAPPIVYIRGPGRMRWLENQTTKQRIFLDLLVLNGEEIFLDFQNGRVFSTQRGDLFHSVLPGSDFHAFKLAPGENKIACFMTDDVEAFVQISYQPTHWGADAVTMGLL